MHWSSAEAFGAELRSGHRKDANFEKVEGLLLEAPATAFLRCPSLHLCTLGPDPHGEARLALPKKFKQLSPTSWPAPPLPQKLAAFSQKRSKVDHSCAEFQHQRAVLGADGAAVRLLVILEMIRSYVGDSPNPAHAHTPRTSCCLGSLCLTPEWNSFARGALLGAPDRGHDEHTNTLGGVDDTSGRVPSAVQADRRGEWKDYDPDSDTYDPCTAPILPPPADANKPLRRQVAALRSRINKGGNESVLAHYRKVVEDLELSMSAKKEFCHKRTTSAASTAVPEGPEVEDIEEDDLDIEECLEIPLEASVEKTGVFHKKSLPGTPLLFSRTLRPAPPSFAGSGRICHVRAPRPSLSPLDSMVMAPTLTLRPL
eukprot:s3021_g4.t1